MVTFLKKTCITKMAISLLQDFSFFFFVENCCKEAKEKKHNIEARRCPRSIQTPEAFRPRQWPRSTRLPVLCPGLFPDWFFTSLSKQQIAAKTKLLCVSTYFKAGTSKSGPEHRVRKTSDSDQKNDKILLELDSVSPEHLRGGVCAERSGMI